MHQFSITLLFLSVFFCACSCKNNTIQITGQITFNTNFDGQYIYFTPLQDFGNEKKDSTIIKDGFFHFTKNGDGTEIYILQTKETLRSIIQPVLIVNEPENIIVRLGINSSVEGTPLNDSLQTWKDAKLSYLKAYKKLKLQHKKASDPQTKDSISDKTDSLKDVSNQFYKNFIMHNHDNIVGKFAKKFSF